LIPAGSTSRSAQYYALFSALVQPGGCFKAQNAPNRQIRTIDCHEKSEPSDLKALTSFRGFLFGSCVECSAQKEDPGCVGRSLNRRSFV
jgi:hypothetical protein